MGRGNVCVTGQFEGLYYIDNDDWKVYREDTDVEDPRIELVRYLSNENLSNGGWVYDDWGSEVELDDVLECFIDSFTDTFRSFQKIEENRWLDHDRERRILLENGLFYICIEDNEWSMAVELIQKEDPYDDHLKGLQKRYFKKYLEGMKISLLKRLPSIGIYGGAWTSGTVTREDL